jgi:hypothetical protein
MPLTLSFDIGHASIGWCVLDSEKPAPAHPEILGSGAVTFPTDDCLASKRRDLRRSRRHIRSTRQRIERLKRWLLHHGVLTRADLDKPGHPAPFLLSAAALQGHRTLTALELWTVLRWYAHNRGYDGNSRWASGEDSAEDTEKEAQALQLLETHGTETMAETICACLGLKPSEHAVRISSHLPYKTLNAAFPRRVVSKEVGRLLSLHLGKIPKLESEVVRMILTADELDVNARKRLADAKIRLPKRYQGGLLFGQLVPRFDNRIIARCPITWAQQYDAAIAAGEPDAKARQLADKFSKVPAAKCREFLEYRFARLLANFRAGGKPLDADLRKRLWGIAREQGTLTSAILKKEIQAHCGEVETNIEAYFNIHPDSEEALVMDPVRNEVRKASGSRAKIAPIWALLPETAKNAAQQKWARGQKITLAELYKRSPDSPELLQALEKTFAKENKPKRGRTPYGSFEEYLAKNGVAAKFPTGRAPYAKPVLKKVVEEVLAGFDPTKACAATDPEKGEHKQTDGVLYDLGIPTSRVRQLQNQRPLDQLTNNHLVRHRLLILDRLSRDIVEEFCQGDPSKVDRVIVEVARELREFSGMTAKEIATELNSRLRDFKAAVEYLKKKAPHLEKNGSLIRKCRIAMDLGWRCPFTGEKYDVCDLPKMEREHIIPYATRNTNALHALVLTWPEVNRMKGKRTARQFISECESKPIPGKSNLSLFTLRGYEEFVESLDTKGHPDDIRRKKARKALLNIVDFEDKELGFTDGQLTQTSHLMKLALRGMSLYFPNASCDPIPGPVTSEIRKGWDIVGTMALACPAILEKENGNARPKNEIRSITHLHHALDAATLALAAHYFPLKTRDGNQTGLIWQALLKRRRTTEEKNFLHSLGIFDRYERQRRDRDGNEYTEDDVRLRDLAKEVKEALSRSLAEGRVMQHIPADRTGVKAELNTWGVVSIEGEGEDARVKLRQNSTTVKDGRRIRTPKTADERKGKLLGLEPKGDAGKLHALSGALVIGENYGLALDPSPTIIPFFNVQARLEALREANGGKPVRVLRNGMLIRLHGQGVRDGIWRVNSIKASLKVDMTRPLVYGQPSSGLGVWREVAVSNLLNKGIELLRRRYTGYIS